MNDNRKLIVVDVGCRWGFADEFVSNIDEFEIYGFDPDPIECERLNRKYNHPAIKAIPLGLGDAAGEKVLYLTKEPACSSLYQPDPFLTGNYAAFHCEVEVGRSTVNVVPLDQWCGENKVDWIDHLKIDTQGSELDILKGALNIIKTVRSIEVEVEFNPMYIGQPLFHDVDRFLRDNGFELWKFSEITHYSRNGRSGGAINSVDVRYDDWHSNPAKVYAGQLFWANANYVRRGISDQWRYSVQYRRDARLFSILGMPDVLGDQAAWDEGVFKAIEKWVDRSEEVDRPFLEVRAALQHAEAQTVQANDRAEQAEARATQANDRAEQAEARAAQANDRAEQAEARAAQANDRAEQAEARATQANDRAEQAEARATQANDRAEQAAAQTAELEAILQAVYASKSWWLSHPLRWLNFQQKLLRQYGVAARGKALFKKIFRLLANALYTPGSDAAPSLTTDGEIPRALPTRVTQSVRAPVVAVIKKVGNHARRSPRFKRFALRMLHRYPGLQNKLRRIYLEPQPANQPSQKNRLDSAMGAVAMPGDEVAGDRERVVSLPTASGINADQRSPLEANFQAYLGRP
ncbi:MAG: FkbM family methyltransferase [Betaproteobacteria bacterium]|nr:FkbM family methyltransferase [Betaproteobacteria bacterium]